MLRVGGSSPVSIANKVAARPAAPQAPWAWPIWDFRLDMGTLRACSPRAIFTALVSTRSFNGVDVP